MGSFLNGIFGGANPTLGGDINQSGQIAGFGTGVGEGDISAASTFDQDLLNGNSATEAKLLAPQIKTMQQQGQQKLNTTAQFGDRSGGVNASNQTTMDSTRSNVDDMISKLTGDAATNLGSLGTSTLSTGLQANQAQASESETQLQNFINSILGQGISGAADYGESFLPVAHGGS